MKKAHPPGINVFQRPSVSSEKNSVVFFGTKDMSACHFTTRVETSKITALSASKFFIHTLESSYYEIRAGRDKAKQPAYLVHQSKIECGLG